MTKVYQKFNKLFIKNRTSTWQNLQLNSPRVDKMLVFIYGPLTGVKNKNENRKKIQIRYIIGTQGSCAWYILADTDLLNAYTF